MALFFASAGNERDLFCCLPLKLLIFVIASRISNLILHTEKHRIP